MNKDAVERKKVELSATAMIEEKLNKIPEVMIINRETRDFSLTKPLNGNIAILTTLSVAKTPATESGEALPGLVTRTFADKLKNELKVEGLRQRDFESAWTNPNDERADHELVLISTLYIDEQIGTKQTSHKITLTDQSEKRLLLSPVLRGSRIVINGEAMIGSSDDKNSGFETNTAFDTAKISETKVTLVRRTLVKVYPDMVSAKKCEGKQ